MYNPGIEYRGDQYIAGGIASIGDSIAKALDTYQENKKQQAFGETILQTLAQTKDPNTGEPYVTPEELAKFSAGGHSQKQGIVMGALTNFANRRAMEKDRSEEELTRAHADYYRRAIGPDGEFNVFQPPEGELEAAKAAGMIGVHTSPKSLQYITDPSSAAAGVIPIDEFGRPVDPNDPKAKVHGVIQRNGVVKMYGKPTPMQELIDLGFIHPPAAAQPQGGTTTAPAPAAAPAAPAAGSQPKIGEVRRGYRYKGGNPADPKSWEKVE